MTLNEIKNINDFQTFLCRQKDDHFLSNDNPDFSKTICGTSFSSELLYILPATGQLENIQFYDNLKFITINNFKIDKKQFEILKKHKNKLTNVTHLHIWNIKQSDLNLCLLFPNLTHLLVSYIRKADFSFSALDGLENLNTLCLLSANKISDFSFLTNSLKSKLRNLSLEYTSSLTSLDGIDKFESLRNLSLLASSAESRKTVTLENLNGIEELTNLTGFEIDYFKFDMEELQLKLKKLEKLKTFKVADKTYENI